LVWLVITVVFMGLWATLLKLATDAAGVGWTYVMVNLPVVPAIAVYLLFLRAPIPEPRGLVLGLCAGLAGTVGFLAFLQTAKANPGVTGAVVGALYPVVAVLLFLLLGHRMEVRQLVGVVLAAIAIWMVKG